MASLLSSRRVFELGSVELPYGKMFCSAKVLAQGLHHNGEQHAGKCCRDFVYHIARVPSYVFDCEVRSCTKAHVADDACCCPMACHWVAAGAELRQSTVEPRETAVEFWVPEQTCDQVSESGVGVKRLTVFFLPAGASSEFPSGKEKLFDSEERNIGSTGKSSPFLWLGASLWEDAPFAACPRNDHLLNLRSRDTAFEAWSPPSWLSVCSRFSWSARVSAFEEGNL